MNVRDVFDIATPSCFYRKRAIRVLRVHGMEPAIDYLIQNGANAEVLSLCKGLDTKDPSCLICRIESGTHPVPEASTGRDTGGTNT